MSAAAGLAPYAPLGVLKPLGRDIWMVDGPVVRTRRLLGTLPLTTRMTVARLPDGRLWLHAPVDADPGPRSGRSARSGGWRRWCCRTGCAARRSPTGRRPFPAR